MSDKSNINNTNNVEDRKLFPVLRRLLIVFVLALIFVLSAAVTVIYHFRGTTIQVPSVVGMTRGQAEQVLRGAQLNMKVVAEDNDDKIPAGKVFEQEPQAQVTVKAGSAVDVKVSSGKRS